jgi:uncharacterized protein YcfJ
LSGIKTKLSKSPSAFNQNSGWRVKSLFEFFLSELKIMTHTISARLLSATFASAALLGLVVSLPVQAQEVGNVISRTAVYQQVSVPRQVCTQTQVNVPGQTSGAGAAMGAIAGGAIGNAIGKGEGRAIATMIGVIGGAIAGDKVEGPQATQTQTQQTCTTQQVYENRLTGYNVVYEFAGKQYNVQLPRDPGPTIKLQITPVL